MAIPISDSSIKLIWENNPDTGITSSNLSKGSDFVASYYDFNTTPALHKEGSLLTVETGNQMLIIKAGTQIGLINTIEYNGNKILSENEHYRLFDVGLQDIYLTINEMDDNPSNPTTNWGINKEWFIYFCDKMDDSLIKESNDEYGGGAQILISQGRNYPIGAIPGRPEINYNEKAVRKIGGFKSDAFGAIIPASLWDISQRHTSVRASDYYIFSEYALDSSDYNRFINRKLQIADLDSTYAVSFRNSVSFYGSSPTPYASLNHVSGVASFNNIICSISNLTTTTVTTATITNLSNTQMTSNLLVTKSNAWTTIKGDAASVNLYNEKASGLSIGYGGQKNLNALHLTYTGDNVAHIGIGTVSDITGAPDYEAIKFDRTNRLISLKDSISIGSSGTLAYSATAPSLTGTSILGYNGYFYATKTFSAVYNDLAEYFVSDETPEYGKLYSIKNGKACLTTKRADTSVLGPATDSAAFIMKAELMDVGILIGLSGTVKIWTKSKIKSGDELVSSDNGFAAKANWFEKTFKRGAIVGKAIEENKLGETKKILVLIK